MDHLRKIAGACFSTALLVACGGAGNSIVPTTKASNASLRTDTNETVLYSFKGYTRRDGQGPYAGLISLNGLLYGTTSEGGSGKTCKQGQVGCGTIFQINTSGAERVLHRLKGTPDGQYPAASMLAVNGVLYSTTVGGGKNGLGSVFAINPATGAESVIYSFKGADAADGALPRANLIYLNGVFYGTTNEGGNAACVDHSRNNRGCGTIFKVTTSGKEQVLHAFSGGGDDQDRDGGFPSAGLLAVNGALYGTTSGGGNYPNRSGGGWGTVFKLNSSGDGYSVLYRFKSGDDGAVPNASLINVNGKLYGTTIGGGGSVCVASGFGCGTVFEMSPSGKERILHRFIGGSDGAGPNGLIAVDNTVYGTTGAGGALGCQGYGCGTVFGMSASGQGYGILHSFKGSPDGAGPFGGLLEINGSFYGTTAYGGRQGDPPRCSYGCIGTVFKVTPP